MSRKVTLKDIARETGVHASTVSRALDPRTRTALTDDVVRRITAAAERLGYRPNRLAAGLRTNRTNTVGLIIPDITNPLFPPIVRGVESVLEPMGYVAIIVNTDGQPERERSQVEVLLERGVDGIVHAAVEAGDALIAMVREQGVPVVTVNRELKGSSVPCVVNDDANGIRLVLEALYRAGHRRIAHVAGPQRLSTGVERLRAFRDCAAAMALSVRDDDVVHADRLVEEEGRRCAAALLSRADRPTAIVAANDRLALGAIDMARIRGLDCPRDVSITGFNDNAFLELIPPGLTTVRVRKHEVGRLSAEILVKLMREPDGIVPRKTELPVELIERGSIGPPASGA